MSLPARSSLLPAFLLLLSACSQKPEDLPHAAELPDPQSVGAMLEHKYCGICHAPPRPAVHKAGEWPNVIARMQDYRVTHGYTAIPGPELKRLIEYLQAHSSDATEPQHKP